MRVTLLALLVMAALAASGQNIGDVPRLQRQLESATTDSARVSALVLLAFAHADADPQKGIELGTRGLELARKIKFRKGEWQALTYRGYCRTRASEFKQAEEDYNAALALIGPTGDACALASVHHNMGLNRQMQDDQAGALTHLLEAVRKDSACTDSELRSGILYSVGTIYGEMKRYTEALDYYQRAYLVDSATHDSARMAKQFIAIANVLAVTERIPEAMGYYEKSIVCSKAVGDSLMEGYIRFNLGEIEMARDNLSGAVMETERALAVFEHLRRPAEIVHVQERLGKLYNLVGRYTDARAVLTDALEASRRMQLRSERVQVLHSLAAAHEALGDAPAALRSYKEHIALKDSLAEEANEARLAELTAKYDAEKRDKELLEARTAQQALEGEAAQQRTMKFIYLISAGALALLLTVSISRYRLKRRAAEELALTNAEVVKQKERAEESERAKDRFLANVSHEIRTPLNAIMGFTGLLLHEHRDERTARFLTNIREAGDNLLVVINDVLDLSRIEAGRLQLVKETFDLHRVVKLCTEILHHRAEEQGDSLTTAIAQDVPRWASGDSARVLQILLNLAGNALKFTSNGEVRIEVDQRGGRTQFAVVDTGVGIPRDKLDSIFDRFTQVDIADQRRYGGTGLGLAIVKELVDLHRGTITVESSVGRGTVFTVILPLDPAEPPINASVRSDERSTGSLSGHTILVAEDNEMNALVTTETLRRHYPNATPLVVRNGQEALARIEHDLDRDIALVLMDVQMPVMDGMTATRHIRAMDGPAARLPIIALTASVLPNDLSKCLDAGMDACVSKPFKADELLRAIGSLTGDHGSAAGVGYDVHDPKVALFHWLVPPRLKALRIALEEARRDDLLHTVHALRPQLVERDAARFAPLCDRILGDSKNADLNAATGELIAAIEEALV